MSRLHFRCKINFRIHIYLLNQKGARITLMQAPLLFYVSYSTTVKDMIIVKMGTIIT